VDVSAVVAESASVPEEASALVLPPVATAAVPAPTEAPVPTASVAFVAAAVEAPVVVAPVVEAPVVVAPVVVAPVVVAPVVEAPVVEAPVVEAPVVEAPVVEAPVVVVESVVVAPLEPTVATLPPPTVEAAISATPAEATVVVETPAETVAALPAVPEVASAPASAEASALAAREASGGTPAADVEAETPASLPAEATAPATASETPNVASTAPDAAAPSGEREAPVVVAESAPPRRTPRTIARRPRGKDLLGELFDALMDLSHMESADAGCKQVVQILLEHLQCDLAAVSLYDIDRDEFVVNSAFGADGVVGRRERAKVGAASTVVKRKAGITLASCGADDVIHDDFREGGGVFAPAMFRDRLFGLLRLHRVPGAEAFETDELDALSYVAAQLGEFLSTQSKRAAAAEFAPEPRRSQAPPRR
jgi:hypothetical protein